MEKILVDIREENEAITNYFKKDLVSVEELLSGINELIDEKIYLEEKIEDMKHPFVEDDLHDYWLDMQMLANQDGE